MKILLFLSLFLLTACSSMGGRAPVYDAISNKNNSNAKVTAYTAGSKIVGQETYTVRSGDTMYSIAWRSGMNVNTLIKLNSIKKPYTIHTGQILQLHKQNKKNVRTSRKVTSTACKEPKCAKNMQAKLVMKSSKEYPLKRTAEKIVKTKAVSRTKGNQKVARWKWPNKGKLTKTFAKSVQGMKGVSISNVRGSFVYAAASGKVVYSGNGLRGYGNLVIIKHNDDYLSAYAHNEKLIIKENEQVNVGQRIATMGDSASDSVHLHFDIRYRGKSVNPLHYLPKR